MDELVSDCNQAGGGQPGGRAELRPVLWNNKRDERRDLGNLINIESAPPLRPGGRGAVCSGASDPRSGC